jgi:hypothetical protein
MYSFMVELRTAEQAFNLAAELGIIRLITEADANWVLLRKHPFVVLKKKVLLNT